MKIPLRGKHRFRWCPTKPFLAGSIVAFRSRFSEKRRRPGAERNGWEKEVEISQQ
jgi:hypothetical protein